MGADGRNVTSISQSRNISAFVPAWSTVFRESIIELGSVAPSSVVNPADAVQIIGGRPVIGSERIRRHARRKVREPPPPQRSISIPISRHKCLHSSAGNSSFRSAQYLQVVNVLVAPRHLASVTPLLLRGAGAFRLDSVGINRREVVNERVIQERSSEPS